MRILPCKFIFLVLIVLQKLMLICQCWCSCWCWRWVVVGFEVACANTGIDADTTFKVLYQSQLFSSNPDPAEKIKIPWRDKVCAFHFRKWLLWHCKTLQMNDKGLPATNEIREAPKNTNSLKKISLTLRLLNFKVEYEVLVLCVVKTFFQCGSLKSRF